MASYRFSASVIKRSTGRSVTAAAAYRAACEIACDRYGETHDYSRKGGVLHAEIMAPENTPAWMRDRAQLWNAVEAAERRKDAQLAREVQLSLPHELSDAQRLELVRSFVAEQFVARGMIADVAVHAPGRGGDDRNHHAHVLLTMRALTGEGFGKKERAWNDTVLLEHWREEWAAHQNRTFDRLGIEAHVDHRSLEAQGIDREPDQHMGPVATSLHRQGKGSRIAEENDRRRAANDNRATLHQQALALQAEIERERARFEEWAARRTGELDATQSLQKLDMQRAQEVQAGRFEEQLTAFYGPHLETVKAEARSLDSRLTSKGLFATLRRAWSGRQMRERLDNLNATIQDAEARMREVRAREEKKREAERQRLAEEHRQMQERQREAIERTRQRKEESLAAKLDEAMKRGRDDPSSAQDRASETDRKRAAGDRTPNQGTSRGPGGPEPGR